MINQPATFLVLLPEELIALTGYTFPSKQAAWLKKNGFRFRLNCAEHPKVDRVHYLAKMDGSARDAAEPDLDALRKRISTLRGHKNEI
ncbi:MAG: DUF4224 domain-containing protein [Limnohabitans sp.]|jgi:Domain of unknown function (DUF4224)